MLIVRTWLATVVLLTTVSTELFAQGPDVWQITVAPYLMGAGMSGNTTLRGRDVEVDVSASNIFSNLQFGAMGLVVARKGDWGFGADVIWAALGTSTDLANIDADQGAFAFYGLRRLNPAADVTFGIRVNVLRGQLGFKGAAQTVVEQDKVWVDPIVGLLLRSPMERRVIARVYGEIGGFGVGSDFAWQIFPTVGIRVGERATIDLGYRWIGTDYESGEGNERFAWDVLMQGPVIGSTFTF